MKFLTNNHNRNIIFGLLIFSILLFILYNYFMVEEGMDNVVNNMMTNMENTITKSRSVGISYISDGLSCSEYGIDPVSGLYYPIVFGDLPSFVNADANNPGNSWSYCPTDTLNLGIIPPITTVNNDGSIHIDKSDARSYVWDDENGGFTLPDNSKIDPIQSNWIQRYAKEVGTTNIVPLGTYINTEPKPYTFYYGDKTSTSITVNAVSLKVGMLDYYWENGAFRLQPGSKYCPQIPVYSKRKWMATCPRGITEFYYDKGDGSEYLVYACNSRGYVIPATNVSATDKDSCPWNLKAYKNGTSNSCQTHHVYNKSTLPTSCAEMPDSAGKFLYDDGNDDETQFMLYSCNGFKEIEANIGSDAPCPGPTGYLIEYTSKSGNTTCQPLTTYNESTVPRMCPAGVSSFYYDATGFPYETYKCNGGVIQVGNNPGCPGAPNYLIDYKGTCQQFGTYGSNTAGSLLMSQACAGKNTEFNYDTGSGPYQHYTCSNHNIMPNGNQCPNGLANINNICKIPPTTTPAPTTLPPAQGSWKVSPNNMLCTTTPSNDFVMEMGDFIIECWVNIANVNDTRDAPIITTGMTWGGITGTEIHIGLSDRGDGQIAVWYPGNAVGWGSGGRLYSGTAVPANTWTHLAFVRYGLKLTLYINGQASNINKTLKSASDFNNTNPNNPTVGNKGQVGINWDCWGNQGITGKMANIRIVKGSAGPYTGPFTPTTGPLPKITGTVLLFNTYYYPAVDHPKYPGNRDTTNWSDNPNNPNNPNTTNVAFKDSAKNALMGQYWNNGWPGQWPTSDPSFPTVAPPPAQKTLPAYTAVSGFKTAQNAPQSSDGFITPAWQNVAGSDSNVGFFFYGFKASILKDVSVGWYAHGTAGQQSNLHNAKITAIDYVDPVNEKITVDGGVFQSGKSYYFTQIPYNQ